MESAILFNYQTADDNILSANFQNMLSPSYIILRIRRLENKHPLMVLMFGGGFNFDGEDNIRDVFWKGTCDDGCYALANYIGWGDELRTLVKEEHARLDKEMAARDTTKTQASASCKSKGSVQASTSKNSPSLTCKASRSSESNTSSETLSGANPVSRTKSSTGSTSKTATTSASKTSTTSTAKTSTAKLPITPSAKSSRGSHTAKSSIVHSLNSAKAKTDKKPM